MLTIHIEEQEFYSNETGKFSYTKPYTVSMEHSLISISKWEALWKKPYLPSRYVPGIQGPIEEVSYIECMVIGKTPPAYVISTLRDKHRKQIADYIADPHTATTKHILGQELGHPSTTITSEIIYYWMIKYFIPIEFDRWHFNRLLTLIDVCMTKERGNKNKLSHVDSANWRHKLNQERKKAWSQ